MRAIAKVEAWCARRDVTVVFAERTLAQSRWEPDLRRITVGRMAPRTMLYILLHECGHVLASKAKGWPWLTGEHGFTFSNVGDAGKIGAVEEEIDAWRRARRLADRLRIRIDARAWRRLRSHCLASYMRWAVGPRK